jgi:hypothetical protein
MAMAISARAAEVHGKANAAAMSEAGRVMTERIVDT